MTDPKEKGQNVCREEQEFLFDAFISYRHADLDSAVAGYLQKTLEHYRIPREIQKKCGKESLRRIFRDEEELGVASDLFGEIEQNLRRSEFLLVICTPRILESKWCMREIETFIRYRGRENVLAVLVEGEPETAFPAAIREKGEPLAADVRGRNRREVLRRVRERMPRLVAPLIHCTYDELYQRHRVYKMRRLVAAAGIITAFSLGFGAVTVGQNRRITENYQGKLENQSRYLASVSGELLEKGDRDAALLVAMEALPKGNGDDSRPYVAEARIALEHALYTYRMDYQYNLRPQKLLEHKGLIRDCFDYDPEEKVFLTADTNGRFYLWEEETQEQIACLEDRLYLDAMLGSGGLLFLRWEEGIRCLRYRTGEILWEWTPGCPEEGCILSYNMLWDYCRETDTLLCIEGEARTHDLPEGGPSITDRHAIHLIDVKTGESRVWKPEEIYAPLLGEEKISRSFHKVKLSPDGKLVAIAWEEKKSDSGEEPQMCFRVFPLEGEDCLIREDFPSAGAADEIAWLPDGSLLLVGLAERGLISDIVGYSTRWQAVCWDVTAGERRFRYEDRSLVMDRHVIVETAEAASGKEDASDILSVSYDNVAVNLDLQTGECYSRMEDRSRFVMDHIWEGGGLQMLITMDGYVFTTNPAEDQICNPQNTVYQYRLDLGNIYKAVWVNQRVYLFTRTAVYCYKGTVDEGYTMLGEGVNKYWYDSGHSRLAILDYNKNLTLYDTGSITAVWQEACAGSSLSGVPAALVDDRYAAFVDPEGDRVVFRTISGPDRTVRLPLDGITEGDFISVSSGGAGRALLWSNSRFAFYENPGLQKPEKEEAAALWLADAEEETILRCWSWKELAEALPIPPSDRPGDWYLSLSRAGVTASGRYLILVCKVESTFLSNENYRETALFVWDMEEDCRVGLPAGLCRNLTSGTGSNTFFTQDGWIAPEGDRILLYMNWQEIVILDAGKGEELCRLDVKDVASQEISFTPDGDHIIFQDANRCLKVYNWRTGEYTQSVLTPEDGALRFEFCEGGEVMGTVINIGAFYTETSVVYRRVAPGEYKKETRIDFCSSCDGNIVLINNDSNTRLYRYYQLDSLLDMAGNILNGRELTEVERKNYLID